MYRIPASDILQHVGVVKNVSLKLKFSSQWQTFHYFLTGADLEETIWVGPQIRGSGDMLSKEIWNFTFSQSIWGVILMVNITLVLRLHNVVAYTTIGVCTNYALISKKICFPSSYYAMLLCLIQCMINHFTRKTYAMPNDYRLPTDEF